VTLIITTPWEETTAWERYGPGVRNATIAWPPAPSRPILPGGRASGPPIHL